MWGFKRAVENSIGDALKRSLPDQFKVCMEYARHLAYEDSAKLLEGCLKNGDDLNAVVQTLRVCADMCMKEVHQIKPDWEHIRERSASSAARSTKGEEV